MTLLAAVCGAQVYDWWMSKIFIMVEFRYFKVILKVTQGHNMQEIRTLVNYGSIGVIVT